HLRLGVHLEVLEEHLLPCSRGRLVLLPALAGPSSEQVGLAHPSDEHHSLDASLILRAQYHVRLR
ncbi:MAG: hypothetical protein ACK56I_10040, partial [bacterium]